MHGDAQSLPFADESFDAVINVEASHGYSNFPRFLAEVVRVLRPGDVFSTPISAALDFSQWEAAMADAPMRLLSERVINAEVLRGLDNLAPRYLDLVGQYLPPFLRPFGRLFVGAPGSLMYRELQRGRLSYRMYCFARIEAASVAHRRAYSAGPTTTVRRGALCNLRSAVSAGRLRQRRYLPRVGFTGTTFVPGFRTSVQRTGQVNLSLRAQPALAPVRVGIAS